MTKKTPWNLNLSNLSVSDNLGFSHSGSCKTFSHPIDSQEKDEQALLKKGMFKFLENMSVGQISKI